MKKELKIIKFNSVGIYVANNCYIKNIVVISDIVGGNGCYEVVYY